MYITNPQAIRQYFPAWGSYPRLRYGLGKRCTLYVMRGKIIIIIDIITIDDAVVIIDAVDAALVLLMRC